MKNLLLICEAKLNLEAQSGESAEPSGLLEARVTTWGAREGADGRKFNYQPEGFMEWAKEFAASGKPLPMFLNHNDMGMPMGEWNEFMFDDEGMTAKGRIYMNTVGGSDLYSVLKESPNMFGGVSVGAYADEACWVNAEGMPFDPNTMGDDEAYFQITKGGLREVSVVMYPNNPDAEGNLNPRHLEKLLRDAGVSKQVATTATSIFKKVLEQRDADKALENTPTQSDTDAVVNDADAILQAIEQRELLKALENRIK